MEFYCEKLNCRMDENTCLKNQLNKSMKKCRRFCEILHKETSKQLYNLIQNKIQEGQNVSLKDDYSIYLSFHKYLNIDIYYGGSLDEAYVLIDCGKYGSTHYHPDGSKVLDDIINFINGSYVIICKFHCITRIIKKKNLKKHPRFYLFGIGVRIITKDGCFNKKEFLKELKAQA